MILPRTTEDGKPRLSYSQYNSWISKSSFNLKVDGYIEYIVSYFLGKKFKDQGWAEFGIDVEDYICERKGKEKFTQEEIVTMEKIEPLGLFQAPISVDFGDFVLEGFLDDATEDLSKIRDYKTCSKNSSKKYYTDDYKQLDIYGMWAEQKTGVFPELEVCMIERKGNCMFKGGREVLTVGKEVWYNTRESSIERREMIKADIIRVANEISDMYKVFLKLNK